MGDSVAKTRLRTSATNSQAFAQLNLVHEDANAVAKSLVAALGGAKVVGPRLYPQKPPEAAVRYLLDCINPNRDHDIGIEGFITLIKWAREQGIHFGIEWICDETSYSRPSPIEPEDARAELQRQFLAGVDRLENLARKLGR